MNEIKINWKVRFKNKVWLGGFFTFLITTVYRLLAMFDVTPAVDEQSVLNILATVLQLLSLMGIIVDPTTKGLGDSARALSYDEPA